MNTLRLFTLSFCFVAVSLSAQITNITVGGSPNNEDGDSPRDAYRKINANEAYLLQHGGGGAGTNINGAALVDGTVNSNKFDSATKAMLGAGGGSSFPLSGDVSAANHDINAAGNLTANQSINVPTISPFTTNFYVLVITDSGGVTPTASSNMVTWLKANYFSKCKYFCGITNLSVSGETVVTESNKWASGTYAPFLQGSGTNNLIIFGGGYNDAVAGTTAQQIMDSDRYLYTQAKGVGCFVMAMDIWGAGIPDVNRGIQATVNQFVKTNGVADWIAEIEPSWLNAPGGISVDGKHPIEPGLERIGTVVADSFEHPKRWTPRLSNELHVGGFFEAYMPGNYFQVRGDAVSARIISDFGSLELESTDVSGQGGSHLRQIGGTLHIRTAAGANNFAENSTFGTETNEILLPTGFAKPPILEVTNAAPVNTTTPKAWFVVTNSGGAFMLPGYQ